MQGPRETEDRSVLLASSWRDNAERWTEIVRCSGIASRRLVTDQAIIDAVIAQRPRSVLDAGCGKGWLCRSLADRVSKLVGIDGSAELITAARALGGTEFLHSSYENIASAGSRIDGKFDALVANFALLDEELSPFLRMA